MPATIAYSFAVSNDGNVPLNGVVINDTAVGDGPVHAVDDRSVAPRPAVR
ncbi:hypothetical protein [Luteimonas mephitis]